MRERRFADAGGHRRAGRRARRRRHDRTPDRATGRRAACPHGQRRRPMPPAPRATRARWPASRSVTRARARGGGGDGRLRPGVGRSARAARRSPPARGGRRGRHRRATRAPSRTRRRCSPRCARPGRAGVAAGCASGVPRRPGCLSASSPTTDHEAVIAAGASRSRPATPGSTPRELGHDHHDRACGSTATGRSTASVSRPGPVPRGTDDRRSAAAFIDGLAGMRDAASCAVARAAWRSLVLVAVAGRGVGAAGVGDCPVRATWSGSRSSPDPAKKACEKVTGAASDVAGDVVGDAAKAVAQPIFRQATEWVAQGAGWLVGRVGG